MNKRHYRIGHLMGTTFAEYPALLYKGAKEATTAAGHTFVRIGDQVILSNSTIDYEHVRFSFWLAAQMNLDAYLVSPGSIYQIFEIANEKRDVGELISLLPRERTIIMDSHLDGYRCVQKDNESGMHECMQHLIYEKGFKHIGFISGQEGSTSSREREKVYRQEISKSGLFFDETYVRRASYWGHCEDIVDDLLSEHPELDAIVCACDRIAYSCYNSIRARGLTVGKDIAVTGFDDLPNSMNINPPLSTSRCSAYEIGYLSAIEAIRLCDGLNQDKYKVKSIFIKRGSSGSEDEDIIQKYTELVKRQPFPWDELAEEFAANSWKQKFGKDYEDYKTSIRGLFDYAQNAYKKFKKSNDTSINLFNEGFLTDFLKNTKGQTYFSLTGLQSSFVTLNQVLDNNKNEKTQLYISKQFASLNMAISRIFFNDLNENYLNYSTYTVTTMKILSDSFIYSDNIYKATKNMLEHIKELGINFAILFALSDPTSITHESALAEEELFITGCLSNGKIEVYENKEKPLFYKDMLKIVKSYPNSPIELSTCSLSTNDITTGFIITDDTLDMARQNYIVQILAYATRHLYMIDKENEMIKLLNENNIRLTNTSMQDDMTGLLNRRGFIHATDALVEQNIGKSAVFFYMDLDGLKQINDNLGHNAGDAAIKYTSSIIKKSFAKATPLCRLGGDEFAAFMIVEDPKLPDSVISKINLNIDEINSSMNEDFTLSMSIGYKIFELSPESILNLSQYLKEADKMLYINKKEKKKRATEA